MPYYRAILEYLRQERKNHKIIYPRQKDIFNAFKLTHFEATKVVIIGQDPYHGPNQAHGLSFSVPKGIPLPPSLRNIYKELCRDLGISTPSHGCLEHWAKQGVLLLNTSLTVEAHKPQSHAKIGWQQFTNNIIKSLNQHPHGIVYLLWGNFAQSKATLIDPKKHQILKAAHPAPLSGSRGFHGCKHFSKTNQLLIRMGREAIDWQL